MSTKQNRIRTPKEDRLPFFKFLAWKSSDVTSAACYLIVNTYLTMFCSDFLGMSPATVGTILLVSNIIDFVTDFIGAILVDNTNTKWGRGRPYELSILGVAVCTMLLFFTPNSWNMTVKVLWVFFIYTFEFGVFNTLRGAANSVYTIRAWNNNRKVIGKMSSFGGIVTTLGSMVVSLSFPRLMATMATSPEGWLPLVSIYMIPLALIGTLRFIFCKENPNIDAGHHEKVDFKAIARMMGKNKYAWFYGGIMLLFNTIQSLGTAAYYWKYIVGDMSMMGVISIMGTLMLPVMFFFPLILKKFSAPQIIGGSAVISALGFLLNFFAGANIGLLMVAGILSAFAMLPISYLGMLCVMDLADYNAELGLPRMEASLGAVFNGFGTQLGQGIGGFLTGILLSAAGYVAAEGVVAQSEGVITMIRCLHSFLPMALMLLICVCGLKLGKLSKLLAKENAK